jgi:hypothetical protein
MLTPAAVYMRKIKNDVGSLVSVTIVVMLVVDD